MWMKELGYVAWQLAVLCLGHFHRRIAKVFMHLDLSGSVFPGPNLQMFDSHS